MHETEHALKIRGSSFGQSAEESVDSLADVADASAKAVCQLIRDRKPDEIRKGVTRGLARLGCEVRD